MKKNDAMRAAGIQTQTIPEIMTRIEPVPTLAPNAPAYYIRHKPIPCKFCGKTQCEAGASVVTRSIRKSVAYLRSRCCGKNWSLPVKEI